MTEFFFGKMSHHHHHHDHHRQEEEYRSEPRYEEYRREERYEAGPYGAPPPSYAYPPPGGYGYAPPPPPGGYGYSSGYENQPGPYGAQSSYGYGQGYGGDTQGIYQEEQRLERLNELRGEEKREKRNEHMAGFGALASGALAAVSLRPFFLPLNCNWTCCFHSSEIARLCLYDFNASSSHPCLAFVVLQFEAHEVKVDPQHAGRHRIEEEVAAATAVGAGGYGLYEHHEVRKNHKAEDQYSYEEQGHKKHSWF